MHALALTLGTVVLWWLQGAGFVRRFLPDLRERPFVEWVIAAWLGALASLVVLVELYYVVPGATIGQLAWPVTLGLGLTSIVLFVRAPRGRLRLEGLELALVAIALFATVLVLRPLIGHSHLGFYFSNNGEFANYAAIGDAARYHDAATTIGGFGLRSREAVGALHAAVVAQLTGESLLWVIQPVAAAFALLAFASLAVVFRRIARACAARPPAAIALALIYAWAVLSASAQCFWTLSFVSQYLCVALWFGGLACLLELRLDDERARTAVLGLVLGALACAYPEMVVPSAGLLGACELAMLPRRHTLVRLVIAGGIALVVANRLGLALVFGHTGLTGGGWSIYGPHRPVLGFFGAIAGFTNPFSGPHVAHLATAGVAALAVVVALVYGVIGVRREPDPALRALRILFALFALGAVAVFAIIVRRGDGNNYIALKLLLGFGWLAYLGLALLVVQLARRGPIIAALVLAVVASWWLDLAHGAYRFTKQLHQARKTALYDASEAVAARDALAGAPHVYVAAGWFNTFLIGELVAHDHDLIALDGAWPDRDQQAYVAGSPILVVDDADLAKDPHLANLATTEVWAGHHLRVLRPQ